jgi:hypothetical protein
MENMASVLETLKKMEDRATSSEKRSRNLKSPHVDLDSNSYESWFRATNDY